MTNIVVMYFLDGPQRVQNKNLLHNDLLSHKGHNKCYKDGTRTYLHLRIRHCEGIHGSDDPCSIHLHGKYHSRHILHHLQNPHSLDRIDSNNFRPRTPMDGYVDTDLRRIFRDDFWLVSGGSDITYITTMNVQSNHPDAKIWSTKQFFRLKQVFALQTLLS